MAFYQPFHSINRLIIKSSTAHPIQSTTLTTHQKWIHIDISLYMYLAKIINFIFFKWAQFMSAWLIVLVRDMKKKYQGPFLISGQIFTWVGCPTWISNLKKLFSVPPPLDCDGDGFRPAKKTKTNPDHRFLTKY